MVDPISLAGLIYTVGKDAWNKAQYKVIAPKKVGLNFLNESPGSELKKEYEERGYKLNMARDNNVLTLEAKGWEIIYVTDEKKKEIYSLVGQGTILMGKKPKEEPI